MGCITGEGRAPLHHSWLFQWALSLAKGVHSEPLDHKFLWLRLASLHSLVVAPSTEWQPAKGHLLLLPALPGDTFRGAIFENSSEPLANNFPCPAYDLGPYESECGS